MINMKKAKFKHDCDACELVGGDVDGYDLYYCPRDILDGGTVVVRFGNEGREYSSSPLSLVFMATLNACAERRKNGSSTVLMAKVVQDLVQSGRVVFNMIERTVVK